MADSKKPLLKEKQEKADDKQSDGERGEEYQKIWYKKWDNEQLTQYFLNQLQPLKIKGIQDVVKAIKESGLTGKDLDNLSKDKLQKMNIVNNVVQIQILGLVQDLRVTSGSESISHSLPSEYKVFNDPIHGHIIMHPLLVRIIDTPQFQRLRHIKQLGCVYHVFPGASHNRFEHSLGVSHLAGEMVETLQREQPELGITSVNVLCVKIAGLCHDLGRGPFSGVFDEWCKLKHPNWNFEKASVAMFEHLITENELQEELKKYKVEDEEQKFIEQLILGEESPVATPSANAQTGPECLRNFLCKIIVNRRTSIDVETMESIARDSYHLRMPCTYDWSRLVKFVRVDTSVPNEEQLCFRDKEAHNLHDMLLSKLSLSRKASRHKTVRFIERQVIEALTKADSSLKLSDVVQGLQSNQPQRAAEDYTRLTDHVWHHIMTSHTVDGLEDARNILQKIERRELYKYVGVALPAEKEQSTGQDLLESCDQRFRDNILTDEVVFRYGTESVENPVAEVKFYSKSDPNRTFEIKNDQISRILAVNFTEKALRVYCKNPDMAYRCAVEREFKGWVESHEGWGTWESYTPYASPHKPSQASPPAAAPSLERQTSPACARDLLDQFYQ